MALQSERLQDGHHWWRIANPTWHDPLNPEFARRRGGRWNPAGSFATLYLNEDRVTARLNLRAFVNDWPYEPEDLRDDSGPVLIAVTLPRGQQVCDAHSRLGIVRAGLHPNYPLDQNGVVVGHAQCQAIGERAKLAGLRGVRTRSAQSRDGAGRELAWFPATARSVARRILTLSFESWFWG